MAVTVGKLNDDTTFLLAFTPPFAPHTNTTPTRHVPPGAYTILLDPWLCGSSSTLHPNFQRSHHTADTLVTSLAELAAPPDLIIISQDKSDHCHRETLCSLPPHTTARILATPAAAKKIRSWKHFEDAVIEVIKSYSPASQHGVIKIPLPAYTSTSSAGEITIANIPTKRDITALHNAIAITYRPPGSLLSTIARETTQSRDLLPPTTAKSTAAAIHPDGDAEQPNELRKSKSTWSLGRPKSKLDSRDDDDDDDDDDRRPTTSCGHRSRGCSSPEPIWTDASGRQHHLPAPPPIPTFSSSSAPPHTRSRSDSKLSIKSTKSVAPRTHSHKEKALSIIYTPHGISLSALRPYLDHHLYPTTSAHLTHNNMCANPQPITMLFHSLNTEQNPWFLGGRVANGAPKGIELAKAIRPKHWISAHDEKKDNGGISVSWIKSRQYSAKAVQAMLEEGEVGAKDTGCVVRCMAVGEVMRIER